jgi:1-aminocyclopropane-1-carboxylate deaminase/D-cysteine desulfhydrase-like pyridoxal-dependent ACC family enzyme
MPCWVGLDHPSGSKVRQYTAMAKATPGAPMIVGCASYSCMQIYVASAAKQAGVPAIIYVPKRATPTDATEYALSMGADVNYVDAPAWTTVLRKRARDHAIALGKVVRWQPMLALKDTMAQCANIPDWVRRVIVPTGSGLTAAGVLAGLGLRHRSPLVVAVTVSGLAKPETIMNLARKLVNKPTGGLFNHHLPNLCIKRAPGKYGNYAVRSLLPDGTPLDPFYAGKAIQYVAKGDCLWLPGLRPVCAMPVAAREYFDTWKGFT